MKTLPIIIFIVLATLKTQAQDYLISFAGTGASTTVDSVQVKNLTQNTNLTLNGTDVLHLMGVVGIDPPLALSYADLLIYPNPVNEQCFVEFETVTPGFTTMEVCNITGRQVTQNQCMLPSGRHSIAVSGLIRSDPWSQCNTTMGINCSTRGFQGYTARLHRMCRPVVKP